MADEESPAALIPKKWQYKTVQQQLGLSLSELDETGAIGWEMCGFHVHDTPDGERPYLFMYFFKRPLT